MSSSEDARWVTDDESAVCMQCESPFWLFRRRHHCRVCGRLVCYSCSPERQELETVIRPGGTEPGHPGTLHRVCTDCGSSTCSQIKQTGSSTSGSESEGPRIPAKKGMPNAVHVAAAVGNICKLQFALEPLLAASGETVPWEVDAGDRNRNTPFHLAVLGGHVDCCRELLQSGCNANLLNDKGASGWDICNVPGKESQKREILRMRGVIRRVTDKAAKADARDATSSSSSSAEQRKSSAGAAVKKPAISRGKKKSDGQPRSKADALKRSAKASRKATKEPKKEMPVRTRAVPFVASTPAEQDSDLEEWSSDD